MTLAVATGDHLLWLTSRTAGLLALASVSVSVGLLIGARRVQGRGADFRAAHEALSLAALIALAIHALALLGDGYMNPSLGEVTIPFVSGFDRVWLPLGIVAGWGTIALGVSYYLRRRIGVARWRRLHRWTVLTWLLGLVHALGLGTDAGRWWFRIGVAALALPALALFLARVSATSQRVARPVPAGTRKLAP